MKKPFFKVFIAILCVALVIVFYANITNADLSFFLTSWEDDIKSLLIKGDPEGLNVSTVETVADESNIDDEEMLPPKPEKYSVTLTAVGDIMMHDGQIWAGYDESTKTFDYSEFFQDVKEYISAADISICNIETTFGGRERKFTGYPMFSSPDELADAIKNAGFDVAITSNNHCMDRGEKGVIRTINVLNERGIFTVGTNLSPEERKEVRIIEANDIKIALLAYTYGTNGIPVPEDKPYLVNLIDEKRMLNDIYVARQKADAVVIYLHFGQEYQRTPSAEQKRLANLLLEKGADVVIGSHPHVLQPGEWVSVKEGDEEIKNKYIAYSLGNFISAQRYPYTEEGVILKIILEKDNIKNTVTVAGVEEIGTWVDKFKRDGKMRYIVRLGGKN